MSDQLTRRTTLTAVAGLGLGLPLLAACGAGETSADPTAPSELASGPASSGAASGSSSAAAKATRHHHAAPHSSAPSHSPSQAPSSSAPAKPSSSAPASPTHPSTTAAQHPSTHPDQHPHSTAPTPEHSSSAAAKPTPTPSSKPSSNVAGKTKLGATTDVPSGGGKVYSSQDVVVTQPSPGSYKAFSATCTHQGCLVSSVAGGTINCPCHGSKYAVADGHVVAGPAPRSLPAVGIIVDSGSIYLA
jgi:Rieske Fe-S protein